MVELAVNRHDTHSQIRYTRIRLKAAYNMNKLIVHTTVFVKMHPQNLTKRGQTEVKSFANTRQIKNTKTLEQNLCHLYVQVLF